MNAGPRTREEGRRLLLLLSGIIRFSRQFPADTGALARPAEELCETLAGLIELLGAVRFALVQRQVYVNDVRIRVRPSQQAALDRLRADLARHRVGGFVFHQRPSVREIETLARALSTAVEGSAPAAVLRQRLADLKGFELLPAWQEELPPERRTTCCDTLAKAETAVERVLSRLQTGLMPSPLPLRRAVIALLENGAVAPERVTLAPFAGRAGDRERHLLSVCQLSMLLGKELGLDDPTLCDLGVASLLHDVGYLITRDPRRHAVAGVRVLLRQRGPSEAKVRRLLAVLEHSRDQRESDAGESASLFARILHITEQYDLLVAPRAAKPAMCSPATVLARMWTERGRRYDATLLGLFVRCLGPYPPGTVLELDDASWAVVVRGNRAWGRPVVRTVRAPDGRAVEGGCDQDLSRHGAALEVRRVIEPSSQGEDVAFVCRKLLARAAQEAGLHSGEPTGGGHVTRASGAIPQGSATTARPSVEAASVYDSGSDVGTGTVLEPSFLRDGGSDG